MKYFFVFCLILCLLFPSACNREQIDIGSNTVEAVLTYNEELMKEAFSESDEVTWPEIEIMLDTEAATANITHPFLTELTGRVEKIICEDIIGYVGVYEGTLENGAHLTADVTYTSGEVFVVLTVGSRTSENLSIMFYGELTDDLRAVSAANATGIEENH